MTVDFATRTQHIPRPPIEPRLRLRAGEWVEIRPAAEILSTLDSRGRLDELPFMPEMLQFCGKKFRVYKVAHKTCDTIKTYGNRHMANAVHLEGLRCDGAAHGGCQARCLIFWKESWLRRARAPDGNRPETPSPCGADGPDRADVNSLLRHTHKIDHSTEPPIEIYSCQAVTLREATTPLHWYDPRHYLADLASRNIHVGVFARSIAFAVVRAILRRFNYDLATRPGLARGKTAAEPLHLQPGELAVVRSREDIYRTIGPDRKNRGLWYDIEMEPFSGKSFPVLARVERIIDERTGKMIRLSSDCIILDGAVCGGCLSMNRLFCPRSIYPYWREAWLERAS